ncbi:MAG TPA: ParB N-terminal domain-containing protein, partial [Chloroflexota bacterium]|nr:ParB N-terminal domain-containing protein [Chloroflexota bacterium]
MSRSFIFGLEQTKDRMLDQPGQPRKHVDEEALRELAQSIRTQAILQPIIPARLGSTDRSAASVADAPPRRSAPTRQV